MLIGKRLYNGRCQVIRSVLKSDSHSLPMSLLEIKCCSQSFNACDFLSVHMLPDISLGQHGHLLSFRSLVACWRGQCDSLERPGYPVPRSGSSHSCDLVPDVIRAIIPCRHLFSTIPDSMTQLNDTWPPQDRNSVLTDIKTVPTQGVGIFPQSLPSQLFPAA